MACDANAQRHPQHIAHRHDSDYESIVSFASWWTAKPTSVRRVAYRRATEARSMTRAAPCELNLESKRAGDDHGVESEERDMRQGWCPVERVETASSNLR